MITVRGGRLLERLEERLRRVGRHPLGLVEDEDLAARRRGPQRRLTLQLADRVDADGPGASGLDSGGVGSDHVQIRVLARGRSSEAAPRRTRAAVAIRPEPVGPDERVRVGDAVARERAAQQVDRARLVRDALKRHGRSPRRSRAPRASTSTGGRDARISRTRLGSARWISR